jgi:hypothetical protein
MRQCVRGQAQRHRAWYAAKACGYSIEPSVTRFAKVLSGSARAFFCGLVAARAGSVVGPSFFLRPPAIGRSNEPGHDLLWAWLAFLGRRAADCRISCARLRFSAVIRAITGGGVMTSQTGRGANSRPELIMDLAGIPYRVAAMFCRRPLRRTNQNG